MKKKEELDVKEINNIVGLSKKILDLFYIALIIGIIILALYLVRETGILDMVIKILTIITPLFIGFILAWLLEPIVKKLNQKGVNRTASCLIVFLVFISIVLMFFAFLFPVVFEQLNQLINTIPAITNDLQIFIDGVLDSFKNIDGLDIESIKDDFYNNILDIFNAITYNLPTTLINIITNLFSGIGVITISLIVGLYIMIDFDQLIGQLMKFFPKKYRFESKSLINNISFEIRRTVNGTLFVSFIIFIATSIGFTLAGLKAPLLFGMFCGITNLIPYIGPYIGGGAAAIVAFTQSTTIGIIVVIIAIITQFVEGMILQPMIMSKTMKLHPVLIIIGLLIFGYFFGIVGMILATPTMALVKVLLRFFNLKYNLFGE